MPGGASAEPDGLAELLGTPLPIGRFDPPKPRATDAIIEERIEAVFQLLLDGAERHDTCRYVSEKEALGEHPWTMDADGKPLSERQIERYLAEAGKQVSAIITTRNTNALHLLALS